MSKNLHAKKGGENEQKVNNKKNNSTESVWLKLPPHLRLVLGGGEVVLSLICPGDIFEVRFATRVFFKHGICNS